MPQKIYDAIVVGSGATGGWAAKELCEAGMEVLMLEAGRSLERSEFSEHVLPWEQPLRGRHDPRDVKIQRRPTQTKCYACEQINSDYFIDDVANPYTTAEGKPFDWIQGNLVGGRTVMWGRQSYRMSDWDFAAASRDGFGDDWPIRYADVAPYYDKVEEYIGVSGRMEGLEILPDGKFLPPMAYSCGEVIFDQAVESKLGWPVTIGRAAVLTRRHRGRSACHYCGPCHRGCATDSYFSSPTTTLKDAEATGKLELISQALVRHVTTDASSGLADGVWWIDKQTGASSEAKAKVVVLCASTLASTRILLNSRDERWPDGLGNSSGVLGHYVMDHVYSVGARGHLPLRDGAKAEQANRPNGIYIPRFQNLGDAGSKRSKYLRGYGYQGGENVTVYEHAYSQPGFGADFKRKVKDTSMASFGVAAFGEMLPRKENRVTLDPEKRDAWDVPVLRMDVEHSDNEREMVKDMVGDAVEMLEAAGCEDIVTDDQTGPPGLCIHEVGTARMGEDPKTSFLNPYCQSHEIKNLYVMDGSCYVTVGCVNPTLTMMALAVRASEHLIGEHKRGNLA